MPTALNWFSFLCILFFHLSILGQESRDVNSNGFRFSGTIGLNTNGISPVPAFSLGQPAIMGFFSLRKNRFSFDPEIAYSTNGTPWFFSSCFRYRIFGKRNFGIKVAANWSISHSYPEVIENGISKTITKGQRYLVLEFAPTYKFTEKFSLGSAVFVGRGLDKGSVKQMHFISVVANITKLRLSGKLYYSLYPQVFYLNLDGDEDSFFVSGVAGIGHKKIPLFLSTQMNQSLVTSISPDPGFSWNVGLSYSF
ncbi:hypothetical protein RQM65_05200 [Pricia sp. S334]|uniref:Outer membrane protein beta-barrel domain-containing protein n=1 Tax=Pricia mediterranea TaxID=3076079 RepID=A0ABU3L2U1_9FLAO|nr:hypothetical protein [Pricia sp. S334]MDT7828059.1 hypothetical protein [Pricia sp. S334]